ncbi:MAG: inositol monophosphatase family protein [Elusimicrobiales bacterium]
MKELDIAIEAAKKAGDKIMKYFGKVGYKLKGRANPLTVADVESQQIITSIIAENFPSDSLISEEKVSRIKNKDRLWLIDPLDGTVNFLHSFKHFSVSIAFVFEGDVVCGIIYDPCRDEVFSAVKGKGSWLNGKRINVSKVRNLCDSLLATGFAYDRAKRAKFYCSFYSEFLKYSHDIRRCGAASLDMAYVAVGRLDGYWEFNLKPWDVASGKLIVEEAGGMVTDFDGRVWGKDISDILNWGKQTLASNSSIHSGMISVIKRVFKKQIN